jgi:putative transposase
MVQFIEENRDDFGVEPICETLQVASSTYYENKSRIPSNRAIRDQLLMPVLLALFQANYSVYGSANCGRQRCVTVTRSAVTRSVVS